MAALASELVIVTCGLAVFTTFQSASTALTLTVTIAVPNLLVTTTATDAALVRDVTTALFDNAARIVRADVPEAAQLDPRTAIFTEPIALHDGARDYYRSVKSMI